MANIADRNLTGLLCLGLVIAGALSLFGADKVAPGKEWKDGSVPFRLLNLTATATSFWACGIDESVMVSRDGGATWQQKHLKRDGETLLNIAFVDERVGYAAGTGGLLLSTLLSSKTSF